MKQVLLLLILTFLGVWQLRSQNTCTDQLRLAQTKFDEGSLDEIPQLIEACMKDGFTNEEKTNAYKLLIQTYLFNEQPEKADEMMLKFLKEFPSYSLAPNDPKEFLNLYHTYRTTPIMKLQLTVGGSLTSPQVVEPYGPGNIKVNENNYSPKFGLMVELNYINKLYSSFDYSIGGSFNFQRIGFLDNPFVFNEVTATITNIYIGLPLAVRYNYIYKKLNIFAKAGIEPTYLYSSRIDISRVDGTKDPVTKVEDILINYRKFDFRPILSAGVAFKLFKQDFLLSAGIKFGTRKILDEDSVNKTDIGLLLSNKYHYQPSQMRLSQAYFSLSWVLSIYKPKKLQ